MPNEDPRDLRRAPRVPGDFWTMIQGVDDALALCRGSISRTGMAYGVPVPPDVQVGGLEYLHVLTQDRRRGVVVLARVVRVGAFPGPDGSPWTVVAFEFMPESPDCRAKIERIIAHTLVEAGPAAEVDEAPAAAQVFELAVPRLQFEATWPLKLGETLQLSLQTFGGATPVDFEGTVMSVAPVSAAPPRYAVEVQMGPVASGVQSRSVTETIDLGIDLVTSEFTLEVLQRQHLTGQLEQIGLDSLLGWFEMARMTGRLVVTTHRGQATLLFRQGALVDAIDTQAGAGPKDCLRTVLGWREGSFEFEEVDIAAEDVVQTSLSALLIDLAVESDHAALA